MAYFVPIEIESKGNGWTGRFSFDPSFSCSADSKEAVVKKLFLAINSYVQKQKPVEFLNFLVQQSQKDGFSSHQLKVELLSINERALILSILALKSLVFYILLIAAFLFCFPSLLGVDASLQMTPELIPSFRTQALQMGYVIVTVFVLLFLLFCRFGYSMILKAYDGAILHSTRLMKLHMFFIARPANFFVGHSYVYRGEHNE